MSDEPNEHEIDQLDATPQPITEITTEITDEQAIEQRPIPFMGDDLAAARTAEGAIYVTVPGMCRALGLNLQAQVRRMTRTPALAKGLRRIPINTGNVVQVINCLRIDRVALWLGGVEPTRIKPEYRAKIEAYQDELAPVAMQVFMRVLGVQVAPTPQSPALSTDPQGAQIAAQIAEIRSQIGDLYGVANLMQEHIEALFSLLASLPNQVAELGGELSEPLWQALGKLEDIAGRQETLDQRQESAESQIERIDERTQRLTPAHAQAVRELVNRLVQETRNLPFPLTYYIIYGRLRRQFRVNTYSLIADELYPAVMAYLQDELRRALAGEGPSQGALF